jgi:hypothetical protein
MDSPFGLESAVLVLGEEVIFSLNDKVWRRNPAIRTHNLDHRNPFPIARLLRTRPAMAFGACHDLYARKYAHRKPSLIKIVDVPLLDRILVNHVSYETKPRVYHIRIFALGPLVIDLTSETCRKLGMSLHKAVRPSGSDA